MEKVPITVTVNGELRESAVEPRMLLTDWLRHELRLTGTHVGCEQGVCGACTVRVDGALVRSCIMFAVQADGASIETIEGLGDGEPLHPVQEAFRVEHGLQCGFCTPGMVLAAVGLLEQNPSPSKDEIREWMSGNVCRCTGYAGIVGAVERAAATLGGGSPAETNGGDPDGE